MPDGAAPKVVLASGSRPRAEMLANAGVFFVTDAPAVDESAIKNAMRASGADAAATAEALAATKAQQVSRRHPDSLVIGADQMLVCDEEWFDKPEDAAAARRHLERLRGRSHELVSAVSVVQAGTVIWHHVDRATMTMRPFSDDFIAEYLDKMGEKITATVGAYELEGLGAQLFSRIAGDCFTILGMPLLPLLDFLRGHGVLSE